MAHVDPRTAEFRFRDKVLRLLLDAGLIDEARAELPLGWSEHTGFSVHNATTVEPEAVAPPDGEAYEGLARYLPRAPVSVERLTFDPEAGVVEYRPRDGHDEHGPDSNWQGLDPLEFLARVLIHVPAPRLHAVRYFGAYSCRGHIAPRPRPVTEVTTTAPAAEGGTAPPGDPPRAAPARRASWARLIKRIFEVDPLLCDCGATMEIVSVITDTRVIDRILRHLRAKAATAAGQARPPPT